MDVRFVLCKQKFRITFTVELVVAQAGMHNLYSSLRHLVKCRFGFVFVPRPGVAEPERWKQMELCRFRTSVMHRDSDEQIFWICFGVLDKYVEVAIIVENSGIEQFILE